MGLAIRSNFAAAACNASASMKNYQGVMNKSLTKISTGKRYMGGGTSASAITTSVNHKQSAADWETSYYDFQESAASLTKFVNGLEAALEAAMERDVSSDGASVALDNAIKAISVSAGALSFSAFGSNILTIDGGIGTTTSDITNNLVSAYGALTAADHVSTFMQNMAGSEQAAYNAVTDTDLAIEMSKYIKANINMQAAQAMVSQANQSTASMLNLLQF